MKQYFTPALMLILAACNGSSNDGANNAEDNNNPAPSAISYNIVKVYPHDTSSYTQGLIWYNNTLYEGTGNYGKSKLLKLDISNGKAGKEVSLDKKFFGEGIAIFHDKIYQLTWKENKVFVYDLNTFKKIQEFDWPFEGWGITTDGKELIISTGSNNLYFVNPDNFKINNIVGVFDNYGPAADLNELEYINGYVYANKFETNYILKINPETGKVEGKLDMSGLLEKSGKAFNPQEYDVSTGNVLNGVAFDSAKNSLYITGKQWPVLFEVKIN